MKLKDKILTQKYRDLIGDYNSYEYVEQLLEDYKNFSSENEKLPSKSDVTPIVVPFKRE